MVVDDHRKLVAVCCWLVPHISLCLYIHWQKEVGRPACHIYTFPFNIAPIYLVCAIFDRFTMCSCRLGLVLQIYYVLAAYCHQQWLSLYSIYMYVCVTVWLSDRDTWNDLSGEWVTKDTQICRHAFKLMDNFPLKIDGKKLIYLVKWIDVNGPIICSLNCIYIYIAQSVPLREFEGF